MGRRRLTFKQRVAHKRKRNFIAKKLHEERAGEFRPRVKPDKKKGKPHETKKSILREATGENDEVY